MAELDKNPITMLTTERDMLSEGDRAHFYRVEPNHDQHELELVQRSISANVNDGHSDLSRRTEIKKAILADGTEIQK